MDINHLFSLARSGDKSAEDELFKALTVRFRLFIRFKVGDEQDADEIVQETLMIVLKKFRNLDAGANFASWCHKVLHLNLLQYYKRTHLHDTKMKSFLAGSKDATDWQPDPVFRSKLIACLTSMEKSHKRYFQVLDLHYQGYTTEEICAQLNMTPSNYYVVLLRARSMLKALLNNGDDES